MVYQQRPNLGGKSETPGTPQDLESDATDYPQPEKPLRSTVRTLYPHERNEKSEHAVEVIVVYMFNGNEDDLSLFTCDRHSLWQEETALIRRRTGLKDMQNKCKRDRKEKLLEDNEERLTRKLDSEEAQFEKEGKKVDEQRRKTVVEKTGATEQGSEEL
ncbi:hypothetical protein MMC22_005908 [Lobaria immixta]|nr:hypothetical protein [Lobaria immixta]